MKRLAALALPALALPALALPALVLLPQAALAHPGHGEAAGLVHGFLHPVSGADHVLAMVAVGLLAGLRGGRAVWALPASFLALMALGAGVGMAGLGLPFAEAGIGLSIVAFGLAAVFGLGLPVAALSLLVGGFAVFHGYAHGVEMPETASGLVYGLGFLAGTALLHGAGLGLGVTAAGTRRTVMAPMLGGAVVASGVALLAAHF